MSALAELNMSTMGAVPFLKSQLKMPHLAATLAQYLRLRFDPQPREITMNLP
jgi:hypothetical protein